MGGFQVEAENVLKFYGTTTIQSCVKTGGVVPWQVLGLIPCDTAVSKFDCVRRNDIVKYPVFSDGYTPLFFEYPNLDNPEEFRLQKYVNGSWQFATTNLGSGILSASEGVLYPLNGGFPNYDEYAGFVVNWSIIYANDGAGTYRFLAWGGNEASSLSTPHLILKDDTDYNKNGTVRVKVDNEGLYDNPFYSINNNQVKRWDVENLDPDTFPNGWEDEAYYYGKIIPTPIEKENLYIRRPNNEHQFQYSNARNNFDFNLFECDYNLLQRLNIYAGGAYNIMVTDCNEDSPFNFMEDYNMTIEEPGTFNVLPNNRKLISATVPLRSEVSLNVRP